MEIRTRRLSLRAWRAADEAEAVRELNHAEVARATASIPHPYGAADFAAFLARVAAGRFDWNLAITQAGRVIGGIGLHPRSGLERYTAEVGYWIGPAHWGAGFATEALAALVERALAETETQRFEGRVFAWNGASGRVLEKAGFVREGTLRRAAFKDGALLDEWLYARLREEARATSA
jgi:RimJ/RimL family protein N-acetyltransferase